MDLSDQQSTCAKVLIESSPWMLVWCTVSDGHRTYSAVRPMLSFGVFFLSLSVQRSFEWTCACHRVRFSGTAPGTSCLQSCLVWHVMPRQPSRAGPRFPLQPGTRTSQAEGWCLVVTGDRMVETHMSHRTSSLSVTVASMDGFHCSSSCTGGMTWSGSDVSGELSRVAITCHPRVIELPVAVDGRLSPAPRARLDRAWFT